MKRCDECRRDFPPHLVRELEVGTIGGTVHRRPMCPLCAYGIINGAAGLPPGTPPPPSAPEARSLFLEALRFVIGDGNGAGMGAALALAADALLSGGLPL